jgi:hypothetical protein
LVYFLKKHNVIPDDFCFQPYVTSNITIPGKRSKSIFGFLKVQQLRVQVSVADVAE